MIRINSEAWETMVAHAQSTFPDECCGVMIGKTDGEVKNVTSAIAVENAYKGKQEDRYEIRPEDLLAVDKNARAQGLDLIGIFHSHPDCDAYFSKTDLENSCPWYSFVVLSIKGGKFDHANCFLPNADQTAAEKEELIWPKS
ncbi:MAG TPA: M67 family metallopeptidase [Bryobacteraceae bacterium]|jgi:proteasome lid subunit RPN8/RPN11|nr:M67 family metallopeptidase [Bryobacteraceae bacterium]